MNSKLLFGTLSIIPAVIAYSFYFRSMFNGKTKPHAFSWLVWGILSGNGFFAQVSAHAGIGAWATGLTSLASLTIFLCALRIGATQPTRFDWTLLSLALAGLLLLFVIKNKDAALCITLLALVAGFAMNIRKVYRKPTEENATAFWVKYLEIRPGHRCTCHIHLSNSGISAGCRLG